MSRSSLVRRTLRAALALALALAVGFTVGRGAGCDHRARRSRQADAERAPVPPAQAQRERLSGKVVRIRDGDSLVVLAAGVQVEVRLDGVDAPELAQAFGERARRCTAGLASGNLVRLEPRGKDKYDRELAEVFLADGRSLNRELVSAGCAWWFRRYSTDPDLEARERQARAGRRGLWADRSPVPPWEFRESQRR